MAQHDYVIDNSTGANVRADINNALLAISSNNSGSSAPSTTYALQTFANTTDSMLQLRNAANNAFVNLRKFDGTLPLPDGSVSSPSLFFDDDTNTGIFSSAADHINFSCGGSERLELASGGVIFNEDGADVDFRIEGDTDTDLFKIDAGNDRVGISTATPECLLDAAGKVKTAGLGVNIVPIDGVQVHVEVANPRMMLKSTGTNAAKFMFGDQSNNDAGVIEYAHSTNTMSFSTGTLERFRIDSGGTFMIGTSSVLAGGTERPLQIQNTGGPKIALGRNDTSISTGNTIGGIEFYGNDANGTFVNTAAIEVNADGDHGDNDKPTRMQFSTTSDGGSSTSERMRLDSSGRLLVGGTDANTVHSNADDVIIGNTGNSVTGLSIVTSTSGYATLQFSDGGGNKNQGQIAYNHSTNVMNFTTNESLAVIIDSSGNHLIGTSSASAGSNSYKQIIADTIGSGEQLLGLQYIGNVTYGINAEQNSDLTIKKDGTERLRISSVGRVMINTTTISDSSSAQMAILAAHPVTPIEVRQDSAQNHFAITFRNSNGLVGSCRTNGSATFFDTSSDYRLKENAVAISNGITRLKTLKPYRFNFKADSSTTFDGFFAHEVSSAVPEAINGTKDEVDKDNNPVYQSIDQSRLVPLLVAAVQELITKVETLEAA